MDMKKDKDIGYNPILHDSILEIAENQIREKNPKETKETLNRLMNLGYSRKNAIQNFGRVITEEIYDVLKKGEKFNETRFVRKLLALK